MRVRFITKDKREFWGLSYGTAYVEFVVPVQLPKNFHWSGDATVAAFNKVRFQKQRYRLLWAEPGPLSDWVDSPWGRSLVNYPDKWKQEPIGVEWFEYREEGMDAEPMFDVFSIEARRVRRFQDAVHLPAPAWTPPP